MKIRRIVLGMIAASIMTACSNTGVQEGETTTEVIINENMPQEDTVIDGQDVQKNQDEEKVSQEGIDVDLTTLSATMVYAEVYCMVTNPEDYIGKTVKMEGSFSVVDIPVSGKIYYSVVIEDAAGCCAQGLEFQLAGDYVYPDDYPEIGEQVLVVGEFETYYEEEQMYCRLTNASFQ